MLFGILQQLLHHLNKWVSLIALSQIRVSWNSRCKALNHLRQYSLGFNKTETGTISTRLRLKQYSTRLRLKQFKQDWEWNNLWQYSFQWDSNDSRQWDWKQKRQKALDSTRLKHKHKQDWNLKSRLKTKTI